MTVTATGARSARSAHSAHRAHRAHRAHVTDNSKKRAGAGGWPRLKAYG